MRVLRVAFSGCSGTGKTTLAKWVSEEFGLPFCTVLARDVAKEMGFPTVYALGEAGKRPEFARKVFDRKRDWERAHFDTGFVTERSQFDEFAYGIMHSHEIYTMEWIREIQVAQALYNHVYILPKAFHQDLSDDPARKTAPGYHHIYEGVLRGLVEDARDAHSARYSTLPFREVEQRKAIIRRDFQSYLGPVIH